jgi:hypothetical protein
VLLLLQGLRYAVSMQLSHAISRPVIPKHHPAGGPNTTFGLASVIASRIGSTVLVLVQLVLSCVTCALAVWRLSKACDYTGVSDVDNLTTALYVLYALCVASAVTALLITSGHCVAYGIPSSHQGLSCGGHGTAICVTKACLRVRWISYSLISGASLPGGFSRWQLSLA